MPLQPPEAMHDCAWAEAQLKVAAAPEATCGGVAVSCAVGSGLTVTVTVAD
jgi:hypothetical protein